MVDRREYTAKKLREIRLQKGWSTTKVAAEVGVNQSTIVRMEGVGNRLDSMLLAKVCRLYGVPTDMVLGLYNDDVEEWPAELATVEV